MTTNKVDTTPKPRKPQQKEEGGIATEVTLTSRTVAEQEAKIFFFKKRKNPPINSINRIRSSRTGCDDTNHGHCCKAPLGVWVYFRTFLAWTRGPLAAYFKEPLYDDEHNRRLTIRRRVPWWHSLSVVHTADNNSGGCHKLRRESPDDGCQLRRHESHGFSVYCGPICTLVCPRNGSRAVSL